MTRFQPRTDIVSWGRTLRAAHRVARPAFKDELPALLAEGSAGTNKVLPIGLGRSYGDSGLNAGGALIDMTGLDRFMALDAEGLLVADAGTSLADILALAITRGFFLPVTPGTRFVTLGGAVANDVHGKNHHGAGSIGRWVREIGLLRSDGTEHVLRPEDNTGLFAATIGGLGLTGLMTHVALQLKPIASTLLDVETIRFEGLRDFFRLAEESAETHEYTVAWVDCLAAGTSLGRGIFSRARHVEAGTLDPRVKRSGPKVPIDAPGLLLNRFSISAFNNLYYALAGQRTGVRRGPLWPFFYPLDRIGSWNRLYGKRGMYQYQSVVPPAAAEEATAAMLREISAAGQGSFLVVLKTFGALRSPGLLSFPREGTTLALDFPNRGAATRDLLGRLDAIVRNAGGALYPAKDGRIPAELFRSSYPALDTFAQHVDPGFSSSLWRRMQA